MITVQDYIRQILKKKKWTLERFAKEITKVKKEAGINTVTKKQNVSNYLNMVDKHFLGVKQLVLWEKALGIPPNSLTKMVEQPKTRGSIKKFEKVKESVWK